MSEDTLRDLKRTAAKFRDRAGALDDELSRATARASEARLTADRARAGLLAGTAGSDAVARAVRASDDADTVRSHVAEALDVVNADLARVVGEIESEERRREVERQEVIAVSLRSEAREELRRWADGIVALHDPLRRHREIRERLARECPLVAGVDTPSVDALATALRLVWSRGDNRPEYQMRYFWFVRSILREPLEPHDGIPTFTNELGIL